MKNVGAFDLSMSDTMKQRFTTCEYLSGSSYFEKSGGVVKVYLRFRNGYLRKINIQKVGMLFFVIPLFPKKEIQIWMRLLHLHEERKSLWMTS